MQTAYWLVFKLRGKHMSPFSTHARQHISHSCDRIVLRADDSKTVRWAPPIQRAVSYSLALPNNPKMMGQPYVHRNNQWSDLCS